MSALSIQPTFPIFTETDGQPLENGYIWIGTVNLDPQVHPINVYWDAALTIQAAQPIRTLNGYPSRNGTPARMYVDSDYSIRVMNSKGSMVYSAPAATERYGNIITLSNLDFIQSGTGAVTRTALAKMREIISVADFGAVGDGVTDDSAAIQLAATAAAGRSLYFPGGTYGVTTTITLPAGITVYGDGVGVSTIKKLGSGTANVFYGLNVSNIIVRDLSFYGNSQSSASGNGLAIWIAQDSSAIEIGHDYQIVDCRFDNFKGDYWVKFTNDNTTYDMTGVYVENNYFNSMTGNARDGTNVGVPSACVWVQGSQAGADVTDIVIQDNIANCAYIKTFASLFQGSKRAVISGNIVNQCGTNAQISDNAGAYAFIAYDSSGLNLVENVVFSDNIVNGVRSIGIYGAAAQDLRIVGNKINNQTDTNITNLPKGGICLNACRNVVVSSNQIDNCAKYGVQWQPYDIASSSKIIIDGNSIASCEYAVKLYSFTADSGDVSVTDNVLVANIYGIELETIGAVNINKLVIDSNNISSAVAGSIGVRMISSDATYNVQRTVISNNSIKTAQYGVIWQTNTLGVLAVSGNTFFGPFVTRALDVADSTKVSIVGNTFADQSSGGQCLYTVGTQGSMHGNIFTGCATGNLIVAGGTAMGYAAPGWTPTGMGERVQNIVASEAGSGGSKYILDSWYYDGTAWREQRTLTGN